MTAFVRFNRRQANRIQVLGTRSKYSLPTFLLLAREWVVLNIDSCALINGPYSRRLTRDHRRPEGILPQVI